MILLWGLPADGPLRAVHAVLRARHQPVCLLDQRAVAETSLDLTVGPGVRGTLLTGDNLIALEAITAVYARPYDVRQLPELRSLPLNAPLRRHAIALNDAMQAWVETTPALVVNRPSAMASNGSKPYQAALISKAGFATPDTLVTTDPDEALEFRARHGSVIYKSTSGIRSIVSRLGPDHDDRLAAIGNCPTQFQQFIPGTDYRVHVVGDTVFAAEINSDADDYRYAARTGSTTEIREFTLDQQTADRCRNLAARLALPVAGIDLRRTPDNRWFCFEVNPSPAFTYYQDATGQKIADAVASLLSHQRAPVRRPRPAAAPIPPPPPRHAPQPPG